MDLVLSKLLFICYIRPLLFLLFDNLLIEGLLIRLSMVLSKVSEFLTIIVSIIARSLLFTRISSSRYYCEIFCWFNSLFADEPSFGGSQYLLYFVNCLIGSFKCTKYDDLKVII